MHANPLKFALIIPTLNAEKDPWINVLDAIKKQRLQPNFKLILDSCSSDNTTIIARSYEYDIHTVEDGTFDHAGTRKWGISLVADKVDIVIFMTQDALLNNTDSFNNLLNSFSEPYVAVAYGRQLPREGANHIETFSRIQNYPDCSEIRSLNDKERLGMKIAFCSDAFAAYRVQAIKKFNAFPDKSIIGEDSITVINMLINGYKIHYNSMATVKHSHDYTIKQEFQRYFDTGVFHDEYSALIDSLGKAEKAGANYVKAELAYLFRHKPRLIPQSIIRTISKFIGYKLGRKHKYLSTAMKKRCAMHKFYFK